MLPVHPIGVANGQSSLAVPTEIRHQLDLAEAELAVLKQEGVLRHLVTTGEPTADAVEQLARLRAIVAKLSPAVTGAPGG